MICCRFIFKPGAYDDDFHRLDGQIDQFARSLPGFEKVETWRAPESDVAKGHVQRWHDGYRIVVSEITATYGAGRLLD